MNEFYHLRAFRYGKSLWQEHVDAVARFLKSWQTPPNLILIGPSAGYSLPLDWLARFDSITVVEPGWFARKILGSKLLSLNTPVRYVNQSLSFEAPDFLRGLDLTDAGVLFANVLGQVEVKNEAKLGESLRATLQNVNWASYHDRFSCDQVVWTYPDGEVERVLSTEELIPQTATQQYRQMPEVREHLASDVLATLGPKRVRYWDWQITPHQVHLIEGMIRG